MTFSFKRSKYKIKILVQYFDPRSSYAAKLDFQRLWVYVGDSLEGKPLGKHQVLKNLRFVENSLGSRVLLITYVPTYFYVYICIIFD